jgi:hypothetical protein
VCGFLNFVVFIYLISSLLAELLHQQALQISTRPDGGNVEAALMKAIQECADDLGTGKGRASLAPNTRGETIEGEDLPLEQND